jgi:hypothetical protein
LTYEPQTRPKINSYIKSNSFHRSKKSGLNRFDLIQGLELSLDSVTVYNGTSSFLGIAQNTTYSEGNDANVTYIAKRGTVCKANVIGGTGRFITIGSDNILTRTASFTDRTIGIDYGLILGTVRFVQLFTDSELAGLEVTTQLITENSNKVATTQYVQNRINRSPIANNIFIDGSVARLAGMSATSDSNNNIGVGASALPNLTSGTFNTTVGSSVMFTNYTGSKNTAVGRGVLYTHPSGNNNSGFGSEALYNLNAGDNNIGIGVDAGRLRLL